VLNKKFIYIYIYIFYATESVNVLKYKVYPIIINICLQIMSRDSSDIIATRFGLDGPGIESRWRKRFCAPVQTVPGAHTACYTKGTWSFPGVKRLGCGDDHPPPYSAEVRERVNLYHYCPSGTSWSVPE
jgi:hypothetical protein